MVIIHTCTYMVNMKLWESNNFEFEDKSVRSLHGSVVRFKVAVARGGHVAVAGDEPVAGVHNCTLHLKRHCFST